MDKLRTTMRQLAREKIIKSQQSAKSKSKSKSTKSKKSDKSKSSKTQTTKTFFPEIPTGYFGYSRPHESRLPTEREKKIIEKFKTELRELKEKKNFILKTVRRKAGEIKGN